uniref:Uroporphyrinogen decarboxylase n=1 Tax=Thermogemmatispora argillosa TaxID=2045280 RepID=A0A455T6N1_9CHLR|nr:uroporphyrinogen decarboxylase [Thermogemmatispora argillosa]
MAETMTPYERVRAALAGEAVDRVPFVFWHHFRPEGSGQRLAQMTLEFFVEKFALDIIKVMPDLPYPLPTDGSARLEELAGHPRLDLTTPSFREQVVCVRAIRERVGPEYPLIVTLFSPLTYVLRAIGKRQGVALIRAQPEAARRAMETIAANLRLLMGELIRAGASGIFFSCMGATTADFTREEYGELGRPYDLAALEGAQGGWLNVVHVHADPDQTEDEVYFESFVDYPVQVMSWSDRLTGPSLSEALQLTSKALMGGLHERGPLTRGSEEELKNEMLSAISQTNARRLILANGCSVPDETPEEWLHLARRLLETPGLARSQ